MSKLYYSKLYVKSQYSHAFLTPANRWYTLDYLFDKMGGMTKIILASQSPRRKELLTDMGIVFDVMPSNFDEKLDDARSPEDVAEELAAGKAMAVAKEFPSAIVIGADTIVTIDGKQLEKPTSEENAVELLTMLAGKTHEVTTGIAVIGLNEGIHLIDSDTARVTFKPYDEEAIRAYVATGDPMDKAGAYGIQSGAAPLIAKFDGHYDTVVGLTTSLLAEMLQMIGIHADAVEL